MTLAGVTYSQTTKVEQARVLPTHEYTGTLHIVAEELVV